MYGVHPERSPGDSPATPDGALKRDEVHQGEYPSGPLRAGMILVNTTGDALNLDGISLTNTETGETLDLTGQGSLAMDQRLIIANTDAQDMSTFSALSGLDMDILQGNPAWKTISQTALNLDGPCLEQSRKKFGEIEVRYNGNVIDRLAYGAFVGLTADNAAGATDKQSVQRKVYDVQAVPGAADQPGGGQNLPAGEKMVGGQVQPGNTPLPYEGKPADNYHLVKGQISYEIANHLGNVLAVVTDLKIGKDALGTGTVTYYDPETVALTEALRPNRKEQEHFNIFFCPCPAAATRT